MKIALDYDDTYTLDKNLWDMFVTYIYDNTMHSITFVTARMLYDNGNASNSDIESDAARIGIDIVYCRGKQKASCFNADIWIDDMPLAIPSEDSLRGMLIGCEVNGG